MLTFYLEDDTIHIFEDSSRNSGIQSGTFLKRGKYVNYTYHAIYAVDFMLMYTMHL
jgi:hypothetical protein